MSDDDTGELVDLLAAGRRHRVAGRLDDAEAIFTAAHHRFPADARPLVQRGAVLVLVGRYDEARADYRQARRLDPTYSGLDSYVAEVDLYTGRAADALALSRAATVREPGDLMHRINIAHAHLQLGDIIRALELYRELADEVHPTKQQTGRQLVLDDLDLLDAAGVQMPHSDVVREAMR